MEGKDLQMSPLLKESIWVLSLLDKCHLADNSYIITIFTFIVCLI